MDHNSNPKPEILKGSQSRRQPAARAAQFNHALEATVRGRSVFEFMVFIFCPPLSVHGLRGCASACSR